MKLIIEDDEGRKTVVPFVREEITIGRQEGNTIRLTERNVSRHHARLLRQNGHVLVEDLGSYNGIRINGERISGQVPVQDGDLIQIGDYDLAIQSEEAAQAAAEQPLASVEDVEAAGRQPDEPSTEADAPVVTPEGRLAEYGGQGADYEEDTAPPVSAEDGGVRRQSTSIIRVDQVEGSRPTREVVDLEPEEAPRLIVLNTGYAGREFACIRTELRVGRTDDNDIAIDHRSLSRTHAKVVRESNGEWRVIDMQSANGLRVNGEPYAQVTLGGGDVIELGHVKFKFLNAGETFRFTPGAHEGGQGGRRSRAVPVIVGLIVLLGGGAAAVRFVPRFRMAVLGAFKHQPKPEVPPPGEGNPPTQAPDKPGTPGSQAASRQPDPTSTEAPAVQESNPDQKLRAAKEALAAGEFDKAVDILDSLKGADGARSREVQELLTQARSGLSVQQAQAHTQGTMAPATDPGRIPAAHKQTPAEERAQKLLADGTELIKKKQYKQAIDLLNKCVELDKGMARCHLRLGSAYAAVREYEQGALHYRSFLNLAPDDPKANAVKKILQDYEHMK